MVSQALGSPPSARLLADRISSFESKMAEHAPRAVVEPLAREIEGLVQSGVGSNALQAGSRAPDFTLSDARGGEVSLEGLLREGPAVLAFYRGDWCPYCDLELRAYQEILPRIIALNASLVAISPQTPDNSLSTAEKRQLAFPVLSDIGNQVARRYGLTFQLPKALAELLRGFGVDLAQSNGDESNELPVPGVFIVARDGSVDFSFANADWRKRLEPAELLARLARLRTPR